MQELEQIIQGFEAELEGQIRTKEDYHNALLSEVNTLNKAYRELAAKIIEMTPENPYDAWQFMYNQAKADNDLDKIHALGILKPSMQKISKTLELGQD